MSGGGQRQQGSTQSNARSMSRSRDLRQPLPYAGREYERAMREAGRLYESGAGFRPYPGATYAPATRDMTRGMGMMARAARRDRAPQMMTRAIRQGMRHGGMSQPLLNAIDPLRGISTGGNTIDSTVPLYNQFMQDFQPGMDAASQYLTPYARGDYANVTNDPILNAVIDNTARDMSEAAGARFAQMGRFASPDMSQTIAQQTGDVASQMRLNALQAERARQLQAAGMLDQSALGFGQLRAGALGALTDIEAQNLQNQMQATGMLGNAYQGGLQRQMGWAGMLPTAQSMQYVPAQQMYQAGQWQQQDLQNQINANVGQFNTAQQAPWNRLGAATGIIYGNPAANFGLSTGYNTGSSMGSQAAYVPYNPMIGAGMGALGGAAYGSQLMPGAGTAIGGLLGGLGGLMG